MTSIPIDSGGAIESKTTANSRSNKSANASSSHKTTAEERAQNRAIAERRVAEQEQLLGLQREIQEQRLGLQREIASRPRGPSQQTTRSPGRAALLGGNAKFSKPATFALLLLGLMLAAQVLFGDLGKKLSNWMNYYRGVPAPHPVPPQAPQGATQPTPQMTAPSTNNQGPI